MNELRTEIKIERPADDVWRVVGDFAGIGSWIPGVISCEVADDVRMVTTSRATVTEKLVSKDDISRTISYSVVDGLPVESHVASIRVSPDADRSIVTWSVEASPEEMAVSLVDAYQKLLQALKTYFESGHE